MKTLSILGSTGSIGQNTLRIVAQFPDLYRVWALAAKYSVDTLAQQIRQFHPKIVAVYDSQTAETLRNLIIDVPDVRIVHGQDGYMAVATDDAVDVVVAAFVGAAGLIPLLKAINAGKDIALANKETLVMAGELVMDQVQRHHVALLPVDSEHSAIFQCLEGRRKADVDRILLTASGGPFRKFSKEQMQRITPEQALNHPTWEMGNKITIDSATLMNKGLEVIEARWLFDMPADHIQVVIHPQSIVHSMVAFRDGSVLAQLGIPDMKGAIAYALSCPNRLPLNQPIPDFAQLGSLTFEDPDMDRFPCLNLAFQACQTGGTLPAVMNAANEIAVEQFLNGHLPYHAIATLIERVMQQHDPVAHPDLDQILEADAWARETAKNHILTDLE